jgi:hypothetical protein
MEFKPIKSFTEIDGWCNFDALYGRFVSDIPDGGTFVEVGTWLGRSICSFVAQAKLYGKKIKVVGIDTFQGSPEVQLHTDAIAEHGGSILDHFKFNVAQLGYTDDIIVMPMTSEEASIQFANDSVDGVFIDANHLYSYVKKDIEVWFPKVKRGGFIAGHDFYNDVQKAVEEYFFPRGHAVSRSGLGDCWLVHKQ